MNRNRAMFLLFILIGLGLPSQELLGGPGGFGQNIPTPSAQVNAVRWVTVRDMESPMIEVEVLFSIPEGLYQQRNDDFFYLAPGESDLFGDFSTQYLPDLEHLEKYDSKDPPVKMIFRSTPTGPLDRFKLRVHYQICNYDGVCFIPNSLEIEVDLPVTVFAGTDNETDLSSSDGIGAALNPDGLSLPLALLFALLGGLLLNVMPCVFPLISIKAMNLINLKKNEDGKPFIAALFYSAGVVLSLLSLALVVIIIQSAGGFVGWGIFFQNSWFVFIMILVIFGFSLSLLGVYTLVQPSITTQKKSGYLGELSSGLFAVIIATPCTAPFLGPALAFAFSQDPLTILLFFLVVGIGFSLPYLVFTLFPGLLKLLPKPGAWMETFERIMGFVLMGTALYLFNTLVAQVDKSQIFGPVLVVFILGILLWFWGKVAGPTKGWLANSLATVGVLGLTVFSSIFFVDFTYDQDSSSITIEDEFWNPYDPEVLTQMIETGKPVFVDVWAEWCTNCKVNEAVVFNREDVRERILELGVLPMKADFTRPNEEINEFLQQVGRVGLPVYALYIPGEDTPRFFPELLEPGGFLKQLEEWLN